MKQIKILDIFPDIYTVGLEKEMEDRKKVREELLKSTNGLVVLDSLFVEKGSDSIECLYDAAMAVPYIVKLAKWGQENGYHAALLDCFMDPGLDECREMFEMPIFGVCQSACNLAVRLGGEFSVIGILEDMDRCIKQNLAKYGIWQQLKSIPVVDVPVLDLHSHVGEVVERIIEAGYSAVKHDKAKSLVFGCTGLSPLVEPVMDGLAAKGVCVPVIEPFRAALYDAISCVMMGVSHSKEAYRPVRDKKRILDWEV